MNPGRLAWGVLLLASACAAFACGDCGDGGDGGASGPAGAGGAGASGGGGTGGPPVECGPGDVQRGSGCADEDGCAGAPCPPRMACIDVPAPGTGRTCSPCPGDQWSDGASCRRRLAFGRRVVPVGAAPARVAAADLDADGLDDLVVANGGDATASVLLAAGGGAFVSRTRLEPAGGQPALGDLDGDGHLDVVIASGERELSIRLGDGDGSFGAPATVASPGAPDDLALADVNGDGALDVVLSSAAAGALAVRLGDGTGGLGAGPELRVPEPGPIAVADLDGDGDLDVAFGFASGSGVRLALGDGTGALADGGLAADAPGQVLDLVAADVDRDGALDLVGGMSAATFVALGDGAGRFAALSSFPLPGLALAAADFDGDGDLDVAGTDGLSEEVCVASGDGSGAFPAVECFPAGPVTLAMAGGDFDGDGAPDLAVTNVPEYGLGTVSVFLGDGRGSFASHALELSQENVYGAAIADFDGDGLLDVVASGWGPAIAIHRGGPDRTFVKLPDAPVADRPVGLVAADLDGDGDADVASVSDGVAEVDVLLGDGAGGLSPFVAYPVASQPAAIAAADLDADGDVDLITANYAGTDDLSVLLADGAGGFSPAVHVPLGARPMDVDTADLDGDGLPDVVVLFDGTGAAALLNQGGGVLGAPSPVELPISTAAVSQIVPADLDADGQVDLVVSGSAELALLRGDGSGAFTAEVVPTPFMYVQLAVADFDGDGHDDVAGTTWIARDAVDAVTIFPGDGRGGLDAALHHFAPLREDSSVGGSVLLTRDLDGDGLPDLVWGDAGQLLVMFD